MLFVIGPRHCSRVVVCLVLLLSPAHHQHRNYSLATPAAHTWHSKHGLLHETAAVWALFLLLGVLQQARAHCCTVHLAGLVLHAVKPTLLLLHVLKDGDIGGNSTQLSAASATATAHFL